MALYTDLRSASQVALDASAINDSIKNILLTDVGSVAGKPTFGSNISSILFEPIDHITEDILKNGIRDALFNWEPRILVNQVTVKSIPEFNKLIATIDYEYRDKGLDVNEQISVAFSQ